MKKFLVGTLLLAFLGACSSGEVKVSKSEKIESLREYGESSNVVAPKRKIAISSFNNNSPLAQTRKIGEGLADIMATELTRTGRFIVLERDAIDKVMQEVNFSMVLGEGKIAEQQQLQDADFIVTGAITQYSVNTVGKKGLTSTKKEQTAEVMFDMRVIDLKTGRILFADSGEGRGTRETGTSFGMGTTGGYDEGIESTALRAAAIFAVTNIVNQVDKTPWTASVVKVAGEEIYINAGSLSNLPIGTKLDVYRQGEAIMHEGQLLGYDEKKVGTAVVERYLGEDAAICSYDGGHFSGRGLVRIGK